MSRTNLPFTNVYCMSGVLRENAGAASQPLSLSPSIVRSTFSGNTNAGVHADPGAEVQVEGSTMSGNGIGVQAGGTIRLSNSTVVFNATALSGTVLSHGNNRIESNTAAGTAPTLITPNPSNPTGLQ